MKIIVFGASGRIGTLIVEQALTAGHEVTAFARTPAKLSLQHPGLAVIQGDVVMSQQVEKAITGHQAVISALGPSRPYPPHFLETAANNIVSGMQNQGVRRLIFSGGTVLSDPQDQPTFMDRLIKFLISLPGRAVLADAEKCNRLIRSTDLDWTIVRWPLRLTDGPQTGRSRTGYLGQNISRTISRADGAHFVIQELVQGEFIRKAPVVSD